jgi:excisionase family DNA binding protein
MISLYTRKLKNGTFRTYLQFTKSKSLMHRVIVTTHDELEGIIKKILSHYFTAPVIPSQDSYKAILNIDEASAFLQIPKNTMYGYTSRRLIPHHKIGRSLKFRRDELIVWLKEYKRKTVKEIHNEY